MHTRPRLLTLLVGLFIGCLPGENGGGGRTGGSGGSAEGGSGGSATGGAPGGFGGSSPGTGGSSSGGSGGSVGQGGGTGGGNTGGSGGTGGSQGGNGGGNAGGSGGTGGRDASAPGPDTAAPGGTGGAGGRDAGGTGGQISPPSAGQGPTADGRIVFSQDFENGMTGVTRSPNSLPVDRVQIVDDPTGKRGKIIKIDYRQGDNFRTSPGTDPRSWISAAEGYTIRSGTRISVAWGAMFASTTGATYSFAQIIRSGGPLWMFHIGSNGSFRISVNRGSGGRANILTFQPMTWYDFRVDVDYRGGGSIQFYANGQMVATGTGDGGPSDGRWDGGIYWQSTPYSSRTVYVSNVSIGER